MPPQRTRDAYVKTGAHGIVQRTLSERRTDLEGQQSRRGRLCGPVLLRGREAPSRPSVRFFFGEIGIRARIQNLRIKRNGLAVRRDRFNHAVAQ